MVKGNEPEMPVQNAAASATPADAAPNLEQVFREHASRVLSAAFRVTGSSQDAEDVLQTVFVRLLRRGSRLELGPNPSAYLRRAAVNAGLDVVRSRQSARATPLEDNEPALAAKGEEAPDRAAGSGEIRAQVRKALGKLSPRSAEIFALRYFEGYDNHEIAGMLGTSRSTVAVILHRARHSVRESIRPRVGEKS
jgi:RNA polymerase sigma-70 factor (ECF subfamily)